MHTGRFPIRAHAPLKLQGVSVFVRVVAPRADGFPSTTRFGLTSKPWPAPHPRAAFELLRVDPIERADALDSRVTPQLRPMRGETDRHPHRAVTARVKRDLQVVLVHTSTQDVWRRYTPLMVQDRGVAPELWTTARLRSAVLAFETTSPVQRCALSPVSLMLRLFCSGHC